MIKNLQKELEKLKTMILHLGSEVEGNLNKAEAALTACDLGLAEGIVRKDEEIDRIEITVEEKCLQILAQLQPVAGDLRFVVTVMKINNELERIGDLAVKIADRVLLITSRKIGRDLPPDVPISEEFHDMFNETIRMLKMSLDCFVKEDADLAYKVCLQDDEVDQAKSLIRGQLENIISTDPSRQPYLTMLLSVSRSLERIADHATNIAEDVIYMLQGKIVRHEIG